MKKYIAFLIIATIGCVASAATGVQDAKEIESVTAGGTNTVYIGAAYSTTEDSAPTKAGKVWAIKKIVTVPSGAVSISHAYNTNYVGDAALRRNVWNDRATLNYKSAQ